MKRFPSLLVALRVVLGPVLLAGVLRGWPGPLLLALFATAFLSDIFDGVLARRLGVATEGLRRADSLADTVFYVFVAGGSVISYTEVFHAHRGGIAVLLALEVFRHVFDRLKFGRSAAYHMWSAKAWGISLFLAFGELFITATAGPLFLAAVGLGILTNVEGLLASFVLPEWKHDVPSIFHALRLRSNTR